MLYSLPRAQWARPAVLSIGSRAGASHSCSVDSRGQTCQKRSHSSRTATKRCCSSSSSSSSSSRKKTTGCVAAIPAAATTVNASRKTRLSTSIGTDSEGMQSASVGRRSFATLRKSGLDRSQATSAEVQAGKSNGSSRGLPSRGGGYTLHQQQQHVRQQTRSFSNGNDGFGGGQHFPHSEQDSLGLYGGSSRRVIKPERIIIVRHGESLGNLDQSTYVHVPDWKIPLTKKGFKDGQRAGRKIKEYIGDKPLFIYTSPYLRTKQTLAGMVEAFDTNYIVGVREEPRLTEQQFGNFQNLATIVNSKAERARFGRFYYRFPQGESGLDVYNRATSFIATMFRDFANENIARDDLNVIIVTHGLTLRLLVMRWFQYSIADFEATLNPQNGGFIVMERKVKETTDSRFFSEPNAERRDLRHWYELTAESRAHINFRQQRQFGSLWKLLSELPDEPGVLPEEFIYKDSEEPERHD